MTKLTDSVWIGDSKDAAEAGLREAKITAILNVAHDLPGTRGWAEGFEYAQVGLVDGPGNSMASYYAAAFKLVSLVSSKRVTLIHDHEAGSRSVAVFIMAMHALHRRGWDYWQLLVTEKLGHPVEIHESHRRAFNRTNWRLFCTALEG